MIVDFQKLGEKLRVNGLTGKAINQYSKDEMEILIKSILESVRPSRDGPFRKPYINEYGELIIPFDSDPKYHWWRDVGQSIAVTLRELQAPEEVWREYIQE